MSAGAVLLATGLALAPAAQTAVMDLSKKPVPSLAEALRRLPDVRGQAISASKTAMVVADAAGVGLICTVDDGPCLQKMLVVARLDEIVGFAARGDRVAITRVTTSDVVFAETRVSGSPANRARTAWSALRRAAARPRVVDDPPPRRDADEDEEEEPAAPDGESARAQREADADTARAQGDPAEMPTASSGGVTTPLVIGMGGAGATLLLGAGAVGVSAALANQLRATERGVPLDDSFDALNLAFWSLTAATAAAAVTSGVAMGFFLLGGPAQEQGDVEPAGLSGQ